MDILEVFKENISEKEDWVYIPRINDKQHKVFSLFNFFPYIYDKCDINLYIMIVGQLMLSMKEISRLSKTDLDDFKNDSKLENRLVFQYHTEEKNIKDIKFNGSPYAVNSIPKQKSFFKRLGKNSDIFEIVIDIDKKTVAGKQNFHSSENVRELAKTSPVCIRLFFKLGEVINVKDSNGKSYETYKKIVYVLFDKTGMSRPKYNEITDKIIKKIGETEYS